MKFNMKSGINYGLPVVLFLIIAYAYFSPLLEGKVLFSNDTNVSTGSAQELKQYREKTGKEALWTNSMFSGMPAYQISTIYSGNKIQYLNKILLVGQRPASYLFLWFISFFVLLCIMGVNPWLSFIGALAYGFTTNFYMLSAAGHMSKISTLGYTAFVFAGIILAFKEKRLAGATLFGIALSLMLNANHPQMTYYAGLMVLIMGIVYLVYAVREKWLKSFFTTVAFLVVALFLALGTNYARIATNASYTKQTMRGKAELTPPPGQEKDATSGLDKSYIWDYSYGKMETFTLMIPDFMGGSSKALPSDGEVMKALKKNGIKDANKIQIPAYWGPQRYTAGPSYFGAIVCFLFVLGLFLVNGKEKWWLLAITIFSIVLSWGKHAPGIAGFFIDHFPLFNKFRDMSMMLVIAQFTVPVLGILALKEVVQGDVSKQKFQKALYWSFGLTGGLSLLFAVIPSLAGSFTGQHAELAQMENGFPAWLKEAVAADRMAILKADAFRSFLFIALSAAAIWAFFNKKIKLPYLIAAITLLVLSDMWPVDKRYLNDDNFASKTKVKTPFVASKADNIILQDKDPNYKVLNLTVSPFNDASTSFYHKSIGGYHGAKLQRYQDLIERYISPEIQTMSKNFKTAKTMNDIFGNLKVINMLNTKYVIINPNSSPVLNTEAYGHAWGITQVQFVANADEEIAGLGKINPRNQAVVDERFRDALTGFQADSVSNAKIALTSYAPNKLTYSFASDKTEAVLFSEVYYADGWNAYIDGEKHDHFRANYILRGLLIPAGSHEIEFRFEPKEYSQGNVISLISSLILLAALAWLLVVAYKKYKADSEGKPTE